MACAEDQRDVAEESGEVTFHPKHHAGDLGLQRRNEELLFMTCGEDERREISPVRPRSLWTFTSTDRRQSRRDEAASPIVMNAQR